MLAALAAMLTAFPTQAVAVAGDQPDPDAAITFEPAFIYVTADPGERVTTSVLLKNQTQVAPTFSSTSLDMEAGAGASTAFDYVPAGDARRGAGAWISVLGADELTIPAGEERRVTLVVDVPADAGAGGHFGAVLFQAPDPRPDAAVRLDVTIPVPVFVTVDGDFEHDLRVAVTPVDRWRWSGGRAAWDVELRNEGDVHEPIGSRVRVDGLLGSAQSRDLRPGILLPGEHRTQRVTFDLRSAPDIVGSRLRVVSETGPDETDDGPRMVVLPIWILVLVAVAVLLVAWRIRSRSGGSRGHVDHDDDWSGPGIEPTG